jgi:hypothetical protein
MASAGRVRECLQGGLEIKQLFVAAALVLPMGLAAMPGLAQQEVIWQQRAPQELEQLFAALASGNPETNEQSWAAYRLESPTP